MTEVPSLSFLQAVRALQRLGFVVVRQRGSHIRLHRQGPEGLIKITVPAHRPVKRTTLARILKDAGIPLNDFRGAV
ncbi:MAG: type II toxin-antitoxin system HicA family toxin [Myxococcota bacterium]|nr:type II toxin-antitoxin system HicA family toxin [Myxococcota bacterium]